MYIAIRLLLLLLLLVNLLILLFPKLASGDIERNAHRMAQRELRPHKVRFIGAHAIDDFREVSNRAARDERAHHAIAKTGPAPVCLQWAGIAAEHVHRSRAVLDALGARYRVADHDRRMPGLHWVYIPGLPNQATVEDLAAQLRARGERDFSVSARTAQGTYYISLGAFRSEEGARRQQQRYSRLGAVLEPLAAARTTYMVNDAGAIAHEIYSAAVEFEQTAVKQVHCLDLPASW